MEDGTDNDKADEEEDREDNVDMGTGMGVDMNKDKNEDESNGTDIWATCDSTSCRDGDTNLSQT